LKGYLVVGIFYDLLSGKENLREQYVEEIDPEEMNEDDDFIYHVFMDYILASCWKVFKEEEMKNEKVFVDEPTKIVLGKSFKYKVTQECWNYLTEEQKYFALGCDDKGKNNRTINAKRDRLFQNYEMNRKVRNLALNLQKQDGGYINKIETDSTNIIIDLQINALTWDLPILAKQWLFNSVFSTGVLISSALHIAKVKPEYSISQLVQLVTDDPLNLVFWKEIGYQSVFDVYKDLNQKKIFSHYVDDQGKTLLHAILGNTEREGDLKFLLGVLHSFGCDFEALDKNGKTPLCSVCDVAVETKIAEQKVNLLIQTFKVNVDVLTNQRSPLHYAASRGNNKIIALLLNAKADPNIYDKEKNTPLMEACLNGKLDAASILLNNGANINSPNKFGRTALHSASGKGIPSVVKFLLDNKADVKSEANDGSTPICHAVYFGYKDIMTLLLLNGADPNTVDSKRNSRQGETPENLVGKTALHIAVEKGHTEIISYLLEKGVDVNVPNTQTFSAPLHVAVEPKIVQLLLRVAKCNKSAQDKQGNTPLHLSISSNTDIALILLDAQCDITLQNVKGETPLHVAIKLEKMDIMKKLVAKGCDLNAPEFLIGNTPLHVAASTGEEMVKYLLNQNKTKKIPTNKEGSTPLHYAAEEDKVDVIEFLVKNGYDVNGKNNFNQTPLHYASEWRENSVEILLNLKADIEARDVDLLTPLHYAAKQNYQKVLSRLISSKANISTKDKDGKTPLHYCAISGNHNGARLLLKEKANIAEKDKFGYIPYYYALYYNKAQVIKILRQESNCVSELDKNNTSLHYAAFAGYSDIAKIFLENGEEYFNQPNKVQFFSYFY